MQSAASHSNALLTVRFPPGRPALVIGEIEVPRETRGNGGENPALQRSHPLDSLRGALSLTVVAAHSWQIFIHPGDLGASSPAAFVFIIAARIAVLAFFALSGYVIAASIASNIAKAGHFEADKYLLARVFRIVPPLLVIIAATVLLSAFLRAIGADHVASDYAARKVFATDAAGQLRAIVTLCTQGELTGAWLNGPLWSLTFEIRLYVVAGLLAVFCCGRGWPLRTMALLLAALFLHAIKLDNVLSKGIDLQSTSFVAFLCGAMAYRFRHVSATVLLAVVVGFLAIAAVRILQSESDILGGIDIDTMLLAAQITIGVASAAAIALIARGAEWPVFRRAGEYSYTLYIGHVPLLLAIYFVLENGFPQALSPIVSIITAVAAGGVVWLALSSLGRVIERPHAQRDALAALLGSVRGIVHRTARAVMGAPD
jgi:peptidoglycan/LPS O-acetylase OafA/YrhL